MKENWQRRCILALTCAWLSPALGAEKNHDQLAAIAKASPVYQILAKGLAARYECRNFDLNTITDAIVFTNFIPRDTDGVIRNWLNAKVNCDGGPTIGVAATLSSDARMISWYYSHYQFEMPNSQQRLAGVTNVVSEQLEAITKRDLFLAAVWPGIVKEHGNRLVDRCEPIEDGEFRNYWRSECRVRSNTERVTFMLTCRMKRDILRYWFEGSYNAEDDAIDWHRLNKIIEPLD